MWADEGAIQSNGRKLERLMHTHLAMLRGEPGDDGKTLAVRSADRSKRAVVLSRVERPMLTVWNYVTDPTHPRYRTRLVEWLAWLGLAAAAVAAGRWLVH